MAAAQGRRHPLLRDRATVFLAIHLPSTWTAVFDDRSPLGAEKPYNPAEWTATLFAVPLLMAATGFLAWRQTGR
ncbi:MAG TPA: hypothetical protein VEL10_08030 [Gaiellaceae bacterium]|nr:hypothetical protein [Gaiellaceae bacterium]